MNMEPYVSAKVHYDNHLGNFYSWMAGDFTEGTNAFRKVLVRHAIQPHDNKLAVDLGAGHGIQSIPLAELGFDVLAVDFNTQLLDELKTNARNLSVTILNDDIRNISGFGLAPELVVCCGDTISHLDSWHDLEKFITDVYGTLRNGGRFILSFRDYSTPLTGAARIIPVRSDEQRIFTCILDYETDFVYVTDLLYENRAARWEMKVSTYRKLRLKTPDVLNLLTTNGFQVVADETVRGMTTVVTLRSNSNLEIH